MALIDGTSFGDSQLQTLYDRANTAHSARLSRYRRHWRFYNGRHWKHQRNEDEPFVTINYVRRFVDKHTMHTFRKGFHVLIPDDEETPEREDKERKFVQQYLNRVWKLNKHKQFAMKMGQMGGVTGDAFIRVSWDDSNPARPFPRADVIPSGFVFPEFLAPKGVDQQEETELLIIYPLYADPPGARQGRFQIKRRSAIRLWGERWTPTKRFVYEFDEDGEELISEHPNPFGEIPVVPIANWPVAGEFYGVSDIADVIPLQMLYNEKMTDMSDTLDYHASPVTVLTGAKVNQLDRGANRIWSLPDGASVRNLELGGGLSSSVSFLATLKQAMHEIGGVPESGLGSQGAASSAVAMALQLQPMNEISDVKQQQYGEGLEEVCRLMLKAAEIMDPAFEEQFKKIDEASRYDVEIHFPSSLPRDESIELDRSLKRVEAGLSSRWLEMKRSGMSPTKIKKVQEQIKKERQDEADMEFGIGQAFDTGVDTQANRGGNPDPDRSLPDARGDSGSRTKQEGVTDDGKE